MSNINQTKEFNSIAGVQELSNETAAAYCGGELIAYTDKNFGGDALVLSGAIRDLKGFNNKMSSLQITNNKIWVLYTGKNFTGSKLRVLGSQIKNLKTLFGGRFNDNIESLRPIG